MFCSYVFPLIYFPPWTLTCCAAVCLLTLETGQRMVVRPTVRFCTARLSNAPQSGCWDVPASLWRITFLRSFSRDGGEFGSVLGRGVSHPLVETFRVQPVSALCRP